MPKSHVGESFIVALISGSEKVSGQQGEGEYQDFPLKIFCLTVPKIFVEESFTVAVMSGTGSVWIRRRKYQDFPSKISCLTVPKISAGESFTVASISVPVKVWIRRVGVSRYSVENFFSHSAENFRRGIFYCCINFGYREILDRTRGGNIKILHRFFLAHSAEKSRRGILYCCIIFR